MVVVFAIWYYMVMVNIKRLYKAQQCAFKRYETHDYFFSWAGRDVSSRQANNNSNKDNTEGEMPMGVV